MPRPPSPRVPPIPIPISISLPSPRRSLLARHVRLLSLSSCALPSSWRCCRSRAFASRAPYEPPSRHISSSSSYSSSSDRQIDQQIDQQISYLTLAIETSCDDTCVAVIRSSRPRDPLSMTGSPTRSLFSSTILYEGRTTSDNREFGGIYPKLAVESHTTNLAPMVRDALASLPAYDSSSSTSSSTSSSSSQFSQPPLPPLLIDGSPRRRPDFIAVTRGPGMGSCLAVGMNMAKGLAVAWDVPLLGVNHMQAHAMTPRLEDALMRGRATEGKYDTGKHDTGRERGLVEDEGERKEDGDGDRDGCGVGVGEEREQQNNHHNNSPPSPQPAPTPSFARPAFPFLSLLLSGRNSMLVLSSSLCDHRIIAQGENIAIGDCLDKCGRAILPSDVIESSPDVMYGRHLEEFVFPGSTSTPPTPTTPGHVSGSTGYDYRYAPLATRSDEMLPVKHPDYNWFLSLAYSGTRKLTFNFTSLLGQAHKAVLDKPDMDLDERRALARYLMTAVFEHVAARTVIALESTQDKWRKEVPVTDVYWDYFEKVDLARVRTLVVSGGVASNRYLRHVLRKTLDIRGFSAVDIVAPDLRLCLDNAAMIGWVGTEMYDAGYESELSIVCKTKWPLDPRSEGGGILEIGGWKPRRAS